MLFNPLCISSPVVIKIGESGHWIAIAEAKHAKSTSFISTDDSVDCAVMRSSYPYAEDALDIHCKEAFLCWGGRPGNGA